MSVGIITVTPGSPAQRAGILPGERVDSINGEPVLDEIDYQALSSARKLSVQVSGNGGARVLQIVKAEYEPLGLCLDEREAMKPRHCRNRCMFCFVDQLPQGMRDTLYVKDDDWRLSLMMGNYVTLTNIDEKEFGRILARKASPLYISVHATDPEVRCRMLSNPHAGNLMERLRKLREEGLEFHCQIVLCPGVNDGDILVRTLEDLASLWPAARSVAVVPVGLTAHREGLCHLKGFDSRGASDTLDLLQGFQRRFLRDFGTRFVYPSDEFYCKCGRPLPEDSEYEEYPQIENGVGMLRQLERECTEAAEDLLTDPEPALPPPRVLLIPTGTSAQAFIRSLAEKYAPRGTEVRVIPVKNRFFGESITVTGLIVGQDLIHTLSGMEGDQILICDTMLRENTDRFLDDTTLQEAEERLSKPIRVVRNQGESLIRALWGMEEQDV